MSEFSTSPHLESRLTWSPITSVAASSNRWTVALFIAAVDLGFVAMAVCWSVAAHQKADTHFVEHGLITMISAAQILTAAGLCALIFQRRRASEPVMSYIWVLALMVLCTAALDEATAMHERLDHALHRWFALRETPLTDRIDDAIVAGYGFAALAGLCIARREVIRVAEARPLLKAGVLMFFLMAAIDFATNSYSMPGESHSIPAAIEGLVQWVAVVEDSIKLLCEAALIGALSVVAACAATAQGQSLDS